MKIQKTTGIPVDCVTHCTRAHLRHHGPVTFEIGFLLFLIVVALVFFSVEWVSSDVVALGLLLTLVLTGLLSSKEAFAGFGSETVLMVLGLLIMTSALVKTGVVELVGRTILRHAGSRITPLLAVVMLAVAGLSAFISNTAAAAFFLPVVLAIAEKSKVSPSRRSEEHTSELQSQSNLVCRL